MARKTKKNKSKPLIAWIIIIASLIILGYFLYPRIEPWFQKAVDKTKSGPPADKIDKQTKEHPLTANIWVSELDGSMMSLKNNGSFNIDFPSVESTEKINGQYVIESNKITFQYDLSVEACESRGVYNYTILNENLELKAIDDDCDSRRELMTAGWFGL